MGSEVEDLAQSSDSEPTALYHGTPSDHADRGVFLHGRLAGLKHGVFVQYSMPGNFLKKPGDGA